MASTRDPLPGSPRLTTLPRKRGEVARDVAVDLLLHQQMQGLDVQRRHLAEVRRVAHLQAALDQRDVDLAGLRGRGGLPASRPSPGGRSTGPDGAPPGRSSRAIRCRVPSCCPAVIRSRTGRSRGSCQREEQPPVRSPSRRGTRVSRRGIVYASASTIACDRPPSHGRPGRPARRDSLVRHRR